MNASIDLDCFLMAGPRAGITFLPSSWSERRADSSGPSCSNLWWASRIAATGPARLLMNCPLSSRSRWVHCSVLIPDVYADDMFVSLMKVLHRLDHSIHTMRLWGNTKAKELCSDWNMNTFFRLIHNDMGGICLERLNEMRAPGKRCSLCMIWKCDFRKCAT